MLTVDDVAEIQRRFQDGESAVELAEAFKVSTSTISRALDEELDDEDQEDDDGWR